MTNSLAQWFVTNLGDTISPLMLIFLISMVPILELRGGLIAASLLHVDMWTAIPVCIIGNLIPVPFILLLVTKVFDLLKRTKTFRPMVERLENRALKKSDRIRQFEFWGLVLFVGVPLPGTGAWTGSLIAALLGIRNRKAVPAILLGLFMATFIICVIFYGMLGKVW